MSEPLNTCAGPPEGLVDDDSLRVRYPELWRAGKEGAGQDPLISGSGPSLRFLGLSQPAYRNRPGMTVTDADPADVSHARDQMQDGVLHLARKVFIKLRHLIGGRRQLGRTGPLGFTNPLRVERFVKERLGGLRKVFVEHVLGKVARVNQKGISHQWRPFEIERAVPVFQHARPFRCAVAHLVGQLKLRHLALLTVEPDYLSDSGQLLRVSSRSFRSGCFLRRFRCNICRRNLGRSHGRERTGWFAPIRFGHRRSIAY